MEIMKKVVKPAVPERTVEELDKTVCDLCGTEIREGMYEVDEVTISHDVGTHYPGELSAICKSVDMCGTCFDEKLTPWLKTQGAEIHEDDL